MPVYCPVSVKTYSWIVCVCVCVCVCVWEMINGTGRRIVGIQVQYIVQSLKDIICRFLLQFFFLD